jgi:telomerase reverse transcriptase
VHQNLWHFISSVRSHLKEKFKIYIVVADVSKAFNCIKHEMLLKVVDDALKCDDYVLRKCKKVVCNWSKNALYRFDSNVSISNGDDICDFSIQLSSRGGILVDQVLYHNPFQISVHGLTMEHTVLHIAINKSLCKLFIGNY